MRSSLLFLYFASAASAFVVVPSKCRLTTTTALLATRRDVFVKASVVAAAVIAATQSERALAFHILPYSDDIPEPSQQPTDGRLDLNGSFVGDYKRLPGMFPHAAGQIASHGPYTSVKDIYKISSLSENDIKLFKKYEKEFTVIPPGRMFTERINNRVST